MTLKVDYGSINDPSLLFQAVERELIDEYYEDKELISKLRDIIYTKENEEIITQLYLETFFKWLDVKVEEYEFIMTNQYDFHYVTLTTKQANNIFNRLADYEGAEGRPDSKKDKVNYLETWFKSMLSMKCEFKSKSDTWFEHFNYEIPFNEVLMNHDSDYLEEYFELIRDSKTVN